MDQIHLFLDIAQNATPIRSHHGSPERNRRKQQGCHSDIIRETYDTYCRSTHKAKTKVRAS